MVNFTSQPINLKEGSTRINSVGGRVGPKAGLDAVQIRRDSYLCRKPNTGSSIVGLLASRYTDRAVFRYQPVSKQIIE
jgi:hypothetical protein